ncbi:PREDICTED: heat shock 70 kDa protein 12A-like [Amphimedon queenslandica]|uniref:Uncharacterized protein n=1 Tax=Amphimedon queenslandica TaxID=400682 RepID=A0A1X7VWM9_AMPQE|nr:PREDICTED: heat shock 70 kDa protein 12A-like [Amphimedon queenslandica]|eukprot:XP_011409828.1 PREDICTED: heat shock 70 kDa protein 12A-like [Amphimedon queenslandica]
MTSETGKNLKCPEKVGWPLVARRERKKYANCQVKIPDIAASVNQPTNVAAIDFGTTHCSLAYSTAASADETSSLKLDDYHARVPTAILLKRGKERLNSDGTVVGIECSVDSFGYAAQNKYQRLKRGDNVKFLYFERMKMRLQHEKNVERSMKINSINLNNDSTEVNEWYLIEVIAYILCYMKDEFIKCITMAGAALTAQDFDWVITVPAIWQNKGKQMMREAGYLAGLCGSGRILYLSCACKAEVQPSPSEINISKLSLVPEPEAAALYCQAMNSSHVAKYCDKPSEELCAPEQYIVLDIGGGTVDITAQERNKETGEIAVILAPQGNDCGGMVVNKEFGRILQKLLGENETNEFFNLETSFQRLLYSDDGTLKALINYGLFNDFEMQKEIFGRSSNDDAELVVKIPHKITQQYGMEYIMKNLKKLNDPAIDIEEDSIYIKYSRVHNLFAPAIKGILDSTQRALLELSKNKASSQFKTIYLVGGFGGCKYVYEKVKSFIAKEFPSMNYILIVPDNHRLAVVHGAVLYKKAPKINSRCLNRTYGLAVSVRYNSKTHGKEHFKYNEDGIPICEDAFLTFLQKGTPVSSNEVAVDEVLPDIDIDRVISIPFYASEEPSLEYLTDRPSPGVIMPMAEKVGELKFELPKGDILHKDQRRFQVVLDFSSVEIDATVRYLNTNTDIKTTLNFLI